MTRPTRNNDAALQGFIAKKDEIDTMLARLQALSEIASTPPLRGSPGAMSAPLATTQNS